MVDSTESHAGDAPETKMYFLINSIMLKFELLILDILIG